MTAAPRLFQLEEAMAKGTVTAFTRLDDSILEAVASVAQREDRNMSGALRLLVHEALSARGIPVKSAGNAK
jgi:hypothetical protein